MKAAIIASLIIIYAIGSFRSRTDEYWEDGIKTRGSIITTTLPAGDPSTTTSTITTTTSSTSTSTTSTTSPLIQYYFDSDHADLTNLIVNTGTFNTNGLAAVGGANPTWVAAAGAISAHESFDNGDYIDSQFEPYWDYQSNMTISAMVNANTGGDGSRNSVAGLRAWAGAVNSQIDLMEQSGRFYAEVKDGNGNYIFANTGGSSALTGVWQYVTLTYDGTSVRVYLDGALKGTDSSPALDFLITSNTSFYIGADNIYGTADNLWDGLIDSVMIDNTAWGTAKVVTVYNLFSTTTTTSSSTTAP